MGSGTGDAAEARGNWGGHDWAAGGDEPQGGGDFPRWRGGRAVVAAGAGH